MAAQVLERIVMPRLKDPACGRGQRRCDWLAGCGLLSLLIACGHYNCAGFWSSGFLVDG
jgi:hypothetical protein